MIKVSIIVPVYNTAKYLKKCLNSLSNQTLPDIEIIIIDNNSTDNSPQIIEHYLNTAPPSLHIKYYKCKTQGASAARNVGIRHASGDFLAFCDSDDYLKPTFCEKLILQAQLDSAELVRSGAELIDEQTNHKTIEHPFRHKNQKYQKDYIVAGSITKLIIKRGLVLKNRLFFREGIIHEDVPISAAYGVLANKVSYLDEPLYCAVQHPDSTSQNWQSLSKHIKDFLAVAEEILRFFRKNPNKLKQYHAEVEYIFASFILYAGGNVYLKNPRFWKYYRPTHDILHKHFPHWTRNIYLRQDTKKKQLFCKLYYHQIHWIIPPILKLKTAIRKIRNNKDIRNKT